MALLAHSGSILAVYLLAFLTGLPTNLLAFYTFQAKLRQKLVPINILLFNLTLSDLILLLFLPFKMVEAASGMIWPLPAALCPVTRFCYYSSIYSSTLLLTAISVERYLGVAYPVKYKLKHRPIYTVLISLSCWLLACSHCSGIYIIQYQMQGPNETDLNSANITICYEKFSQTQLDLLLPTRLEMCILLFFIPFLICLFCYIHLVWILASLPNIKARRKQRAIGLAVATLLNFVICFAPFNISHIVGFIQNDSPTWRVYPLLLSTLNTSLDPVIFYFSSTTLQQAFSDCFASIRYKVQSLMSHCCQLCLPCCGTEGDGSSRDKSSISIHGEQPLETIERGR